VQYQAHAACYAAALGAGFYGYNTVCSVGSGTATTGVVNDYKMFGFDGFLDLPLPGNDVELSVDGSAVRWDYGENRNTTTPANVGFQRTGWGYSASANLRFGAIAVYGDFYQFAADSGTTTKTFDRRKLAAGLAWFLKGHADKVTLDDLLKQMTDLSRLAEYPDPPYVAKQFSSYDRASETPGKEAWFANYDRGFPLYDGTASKDTPYFKGGPMQRVPDGTFAADPKTCGGSGVSPNSFLLIPDAFA